MTDNHKAMLIGSILVYDILKCTVILHFILNYQVNLGEKETTRFFVSKLKHLHAPLLCLCYNSNSSAL